MVDIRKDSKPLIGGSTPGSTPLSLEQIVKVAAGQLSQADFQELLASQEDEPEKRTTAGSKLDKLVTTELRKLHPGNGWSVLANRAVKSFVGMSAATCAMTIEDFVSSNLNEYRAELRPLFVSQRSNRKRLVGNLRPDLVIQDPSMILTIWDLTSREQAGHVLKTMLYAHVFSQGTFLCRIGETFWADMAFQR